jgi:hypothetical protein
MKELGREDVNTEELERTRCLIIEKQEKCPFGNPHDQSFI